MLNCLFIYPPDTQSGIFPSGLAAIVASIRIKGGNCKVLDYSGINYETKLIQAALTSIIDFKPDLIGLTGFTHNYLFYKHLTKEIKSKISPLIVGGGHWARWDPEFILNNTDTDVAVREEGDYIISDIYDALEKHKELSDIKGISYKTNGKVMNTDSGNTIWNLDSLPEPPYDLFDMSKYVLPYADFALLELNKKSYPAKIQEKINSKKPLISVGAQTGRGCVAKCTFCTGANQVFRKYSSERVINNITYLKERYNVDLIWFKESLTFIDNKWSKKTLELLINSNLNIIYEAILRVDSLNEELARMLKESGCHSISFGLESGNEDMLLNTMKKRITIDQIKESIHLCNKHGIVANGYFLVGMPGENIRSLIDTVKLAAIVKVRNGGCSHATPFPGTEIYKTAIEDLGISKEEIFSDIRLKGYGTYGVSPTEEMLFIKRYNFSHLSPIIIKLFQNLINHILSIHYFYYYRPKYNRLQIKVILLRLWILLPVKIIIDFIVISRTYRNAIKQLMLSTNKTSE